MIHRFAMYLLALMVAICASDGPPKLPTSLACAVPFPPNNELLMLLLTSAHLLPDPRTHTPSTTKATSNIGPTITRTTSDSLLLHERDVPGQLSSKVFRGAQLWKDVLGGGPSPDTGYGIELAEACE
jgi:hypothetical protein